MNLKSLNYILILLLVISCESPTAPYENKFENILGERKTAALNLLVNDFENNLQKVYPNESQQQAYEHFLKDLIDPKENNWKKFDFQTEATRKEFIDSGLKDEIYSVNKAYDFEKKDSVLSHNVNQIGKYMQALYVIKHSDTLISDYWEKREAAGIMQNELFVDGILSYDPDFNNYFHKRIVVVSFSF